MLTDEHSVVTRLGQLGGIGRSGDPRLGHPNHARRHLRRHSNGSLRIHSERHEIALIDSDQIGAGGDGTVEFGFIVNLDKCIESDGVSQFQKRLELELIEGCGDEQDAIGPHDSGIADIASTYGEVLAQDRQ
jgi:hypothetical protein